MGVQVGRVMDKRVLRGGKSQAVGISTLNAKTETVSKTRKTAAEAALFGRHLTVTSLN